MFSVINSEDYELASYLKGKQSEECSIAWKDTLKVKISRREGETVTTKTLTDFTFAVFKLEYGYPLNYFSFILNVKLMHNLIFIFYLKSTLSYLPSLIF